MAYGVLSDVRFAIFKIHPSGGKPNQIALDLDSKAKNNGTVVPQLAARSWLRLESFKEKIMKACNLIIVLFIGLLFLVFTVTVVVATPQKAIHGRGPDNEWIIAVKKLDRSKNELVIKLIEIASDNKRTDTDRWNAVVAMGEIESQPAMDYLVNHIELKLKPPKAYFTTAG
jgi:hypothetical protein